MPHEKSCGAVLFRLDKDKSVKYLLLHYEAGHWDFPKGNQEKNETDMETAAREIKEETGIGNIKFLDGFKDSVKYFYKKGRETVYKEVAFYIAVSESSAVEVSFEHIGYAWMGYYNAYKKLTYKTSKELLEKANNFIINSNPSA